MKNYIFILTNYCGGGIEKVFLHVADSLLKSSSENNVFVYVINEIDSRYILPDNVTYISSFSELIDLYHKDKSCQVINFSGEWKTGLISWRLAKKDYISWVHCNPFTMKSARTWILNKFFLKKSKKLVCVCHEQKEILKNEFAFKNDISIIYNPVNFKDIAEKSKCVIPLKTKYFLMCARFDFASKDFFTVIDAYDKLEEKIKEEYKMVFLGDGKDKVFVESYIQQKGLNDYFVLPGFDNNPYKWMKNASCGILSSKTEGISLFPIEAFACDLPMIITNYRTGAKEVSDGGKNCALVDIGDSEMMCKCMERMITDSSIVEEYRNNYLKFILNFSTEEFSNRLVDLFGL